MSMHVNEELSSESIMSIAYALYQQNKTTDSATKQEKWVTTISNVLSGEVTVGSKRPTRAFPEWATPEVIAGGFATGRMLAGGELARHESGMANELGVSPDVPVEQRRAAVHAFLTQTEDGLRGLTYRLQSKTYRIDVPEEGCLLVYAWLKLRGVDAEAQKLLESVAPYFDRLRFHPVPTESPQDNSRVSLRTVPQVQEYVATRLASASANEKKLKQSDVGRVRLLFWGQYIKLWLATLDDPSTPPTGRIVDGRGTFKVDPASAWPCQSYPPTWDQSAKTLMEFYVHHVDILGETSFYTRAMELVLRTLSDRRVLTGKDVADIRWWLASSHAKRGLPTSDAYQQWMARALASLESASKMPTLADFYGQFNEKIQRWMDSAGPMAMSFTHKDAATMEAEMEQAFPGSKLLKPLHRRLLLATGMTCDELLASPLVESPEPMSELLELFVTSALASQVQDESAQYLFHELHLAFTRRRSLLLLNYQSQVKAHDLPWVSALDQSLRDAGLKTLGVEELQSFMRNLIGLLMCRFGEQPVRNLFVQMLNTLFKSTFIQCTLLEELAADIFMGGFVPKFGAGHEIALRLLKGSCYDRYYNISQQLLVAASISPGGNPFAVLCHERANARVPDSSHRWGVAYSGSIIEQAQVLTTHNMATIFDVGNLAEHMELLDVPSIIKRGWSLILKKVCSIHRFQTTQNVNRRMVGSLVRDIGGLWRQLVFWFAVIELHASQDTYELAVKELESAVFDNEAKRCPVQSYQHHFRELVRVLGDRMATSPDEVVLGWSVRR